MFENIDFAKGIPSGLSASRRIEMTMGFAPKVRLGRKGLYNKKTMAKEWDLYLEPTDQNGLKKSSIVRLAKITTIKKSLILGELGMLSQKE